MAPCIIVGSYPQLPLIMLSTELTFLSSCWRLRALLHCSAQDVKVPEAPDGIGRWRQSLGSSQVKLDDDSRWGKYFSKPRGSEPCKLFNFPELSFVTIESLTLGLLSSRNYWQSVNLVCCCQRDLRDTRNAEENHGDCEESAHSQKWRGLPRQNCPCTDGAVW